MITDFATYYPKRTEEFKPLLERLGQADAEPQTLIDTIVRILELWAQG